MIAQNKETEGNVPGGSFLGGRKDFQGGGLMGGDFPGGNFAGWGGGIFPEPRTIKIFNN